ncbi:3-deoxy-D-manno-octulosonic acid transferase [Rhodovulum sp. DZ06]|uniref:3-deoxy-D-manno-octulosonic acid transferase n=1 Tax=Rhodovulum sp. DZ06 TaxID=3425126 RepID=UPI003D348630
MSAALSLYRALSAVAEPLGRALLSRRAARGKEDPARIGERLGHAGAPRPDGKLVWLHGASVGEALSLLTLVEALRAARPDLNILMTTGTVTSAGLMAARLPKGAIHQYVPLDVAPAARRFLDHWHPDLAIWAESELWPFLVSETRARGIPMALVNARMSKGSARNWSRFAPGMARALLGAFDAVGAQDAEIAARLAGLGAKAEVTGTLKGGVAPPDLPGPRAALAEAAAGRPLWLAASTHPGEEALAAEAHVRAAAAIPGLLTLIAPRHPERGPEILEALRARGLRASRRGAEHALPGAGDAVHVLDTLGEMGAWLRLAPVAFIGGSLSETGGHNPHEPAAIGAAILHGPHVANFAPDYAALTAAGGAVEVRSSAALADAVIRLLGDAPARAALADAARSALPDGRGARAATMALLAPLLPPPSQEGAP